MIALCLVPLLVLLAYCALESLQSRLPESFQLDPKVFDFVLNAVLVESKLRWHMHRAASSYRQDVLLTRTCPDPISTAVHKLEEALGILGVQLNTQAKAIDLGEHMLSLHAAVC